MKLAPLRNSLECRPTILRCFRSLNKDLIFNPLQWQYLCVEINVEYFKQSKSALPVINQKRIWGKAKSKKKVAVYPAEFIPEMIRIIEKHYTAAKPKRKRIKKSNLTFIDE